MKKLLILVFILIVFKINYAQQCSHYSSSFSNIFNYDLQRDLVTTGIFVLPISFLFDQKIQDFAVENGFYSDEVSRIGDIYGHRVGYFAVVSGMIIFDIASQKSFRKSASEIRLVAEGVLAGQLVIEIMKTITHRERPNGKSYRSFPSGHAGGTFGLATTLQTIYGKKIGIPAYLMATFVASSRINDNKHYLSDVVAGAFIGTMVARGFTKTFSEKIKIEPNINNLEKSLTLNYYF